MCDWASIAGVGEGERMTAAAAPVGTSRVEVSVALVAGGANCTRRLI